MKRTFKEVMQKKDWVLLGALVVAIVALVLLITPKEETIDTVTVVPPPAQADTIAAESDADSEAAALAAQSMQMLPATKVNIPDAALLKWFNQKIGGGRPDNADVTQSEIETVVNALPDYSATVETGGAGAKLTDMSVSPAVDVAAKYINLSGQKIASLTGLETLGLLTGTKVAVNIEGNSITDITPLSSVTNMVYLNARNNQIKDIAPLVKISDLLELYVNNNQLADITVVAGMAKLHSLGAANNLLTSADALKNHYLANLDLSGNRLGALRMEQYTGASNKYPIPTSLGIKNNYINVLNPVDFAIGLRNISKTDYFPQYKMDLFDATGAVIPVNVEIGSAPTSFRLLRRPTNDGMTFGVAEIIPGAQILPAYPRDTLGKEEAHKVEFTFDPATGFLVATPKTYGKQIVSFYLWGIDSSFTRVTIEFNVLMSK